MPLEFFGGLKCKINNFLPLVLVIDFWEEQTVARKESA